MNAMFKKVNGMCFTSKYILYLKLTPANLIAREKMIGWYHTGPKLRSSDMLINNLFKKYTPNPVLVIIDVKPVSVTSFPTDAYFAVEEIKEDGTSTEKTWVHAPSYIDAEEAEEIGVEHLLRDIKDAGVGNLASRITSQLLSLKGLQSRLQEFASYLEKVVNDELPQNHAILGKMQDVFNLLPNLSTPSAASQTDVSSLGGKAGNVGALSKSFRTTLNDQLMCVYLSSLIRAVIAMEDLIDPSNLSV